MSCDPYDVSGKRGDSPCGRPDAARELPYSAPRTSCSVVRVLRNVLPTRLSVLRAQRTVSRDAIVSSTKAVRDVEERTRAERDRQLGGRLGLICVWSAVTAVTAFAPPAATSQQDAKCCVSPPTQVPRSTLGMTGCFYPASNGDVRPPQAPPTQPVIPSVERGTWVGGDTQHYPLRGFETHCRSHRFSCVPAMPNAQGGSSAGANCLVWTGSNMRLTHCDAIGARKNPRYILKSGKTGNSVMRPVSGCSLLRRGDGAPVPLGIGHLAPVRNPDTPESGRLRPWVRQAAIWGRWAAARVRQATLSLRNPPAWVP